MSGAAAKKRKAHTALDEVDSEGAFKRTAAGFTAASIEAGGRFAPEGGRYRLYVALGGFLNPRVR